MSEKRIKTKERNKLILYDILFFIFLNLIMYLVHHETIIDLLKFSVNTSKTENTITTGLFSIINFLFFFIGRTWIFIIVYLAFRITKTKTIKQNTTYQETYEIEYYRDKMPFLTATEISLITDLGIENKKDLTASLLSLYQRNIIHFENDKININKNTLNNIKESEKKLLTIIDSEQITDQNVKDWKNSCIEEAIQDGYIRKARKDRYSYLKNINKLLKGSFKVWGITFIVLLIMTFISLIPSYTKMFTSYYNETFNQDNETTNTNQINETTQEKLSNTDSFDITLHSEELMKNPIYLILLIIHALSIPVLIYAIIYRKSKMIIVQSDESLQNNYERTETGNELIGKIAGLKKYIKDFSLLSQREKEEIVLWEDFLVYAVLLEENETIIRDIFKYKNINLNVLDYFEHISNNIKNILGNLTASQLFDKDYAVNRVAHIFCRILTEDLLDIKMEEYYSLWYQFSIFNQEEKETLKNDINNILYEDNNVDLLKKFDKKYLSITQNEKLRIKWQKYISKLAGNDSKLASLTYEDLSSTINNIAKLVK